MTLNRLARELINHYQGGFLLTEQPFRNAAVDLGCSESTLIDTVEYLLNNGILSRFGPLYDAVKLGGGLTLAAMSVPEDSYAHVTALVNDHQEVAHNYRREHELNMWFVLATESPEDIAATLAAIEQESGFRVYNFPKQQEFYIGLWLKLDTDNRVITVPVPGSGSTASAVTPEYGKHVLDEMDKQIVHATQAGLPLISRPYRAVAEQLGCTSDEIKRRLQNMLTRGTIRRIGVVPNHYRLGLKANGMTVWDVPDEQAQALGQQVAQLDFVSHCYLRPRHLPAWRYNLFAMVHGHSRDEVDAKAEQIALLLGNNCNAHETLFSSEILKKTGMRLAA
ncbi:MAG: AsnC family transcriptional regulator [Gammaproteobacteria bacterium]|jgi:DNA-binding Lrp family transcriptional regulator